MAGRYSSRFLTYSATKWQAGRMARHAEGDAKYVVTLTAILRLVGV
jgi:hypothetical protein